MFGPKMSRISVTAMLEYSQATLSRSSWTNYAAERQSFSPAPSPIESEASSTEHGWPSLYGSQASAGLNEDAFLGQYIHRIYCRECREQEDMAAARGSLPSASSGTGSPASQPGSPPQYQMDQLSLAEHMNANKQVLNRKLMVRRSRPELVDAGIYPTSPHAFAGQKIHLERAKTGDFLKHKIERRPARDFLVQQHILDDSNVDPSLQSMQRKLKKAKLTDELNEKLAHRPGPLELVEQSILEVDDPIKVAIKEGKLEFQKTEEFTEQSALAKVPYEIESPKSDQSSPEPSDCDNDSSSSSAASTGFNPPQVPSPPDIAPFLTKSTCNSITVGGKTMSIPITTASFMSPSQLITVPSPQQFPVHSHLQRPQHPSNFSFNKNNRRTAKLNRPKQQPKQRIIKFHEYKGPTASKSSNSSASNSLGSFVTTTGPMQKLDGLTPYEVRVHQQNLYLQCQIEVESKGASPTVLVPIKTSPGTPLMQHPLLQHQHSVPQQQEMQEPATPKPSETPRSRPVTPSLSLRSPPPALSAGSYHNPLHVSRSLSHLEDLKVADLKLELKQRHLPVSGSKPQLIDRLRSHQLKEMSASIPSLGSSSTSSEFSYSTGIPSVQSYSEDGVMAPPSVASVSGMSVATHLSSPPPTPCSPRDEYMKAMPAVASRVQGMETDDSNSQTKSTAEIVLEQAKQIEDLQRRLMQVQQQFQMVQQPFDASPSGVTQKRETSELQSPSSTQPQMLLNVKLQQMQELLQQNAPQQPDQKVGQLQHQQAFAAPVMQQKASPIDITDKQVYLATPDGKMTAYKVILHTSNGMLQQPVPTSQPSDQPPQVPMGVSFQMSDGQMMSPSNLTTTSESSTTHKDDYSQISQKMEVGKTDVSELDDVDDVIDVLIKAGEMDPQTMNQPQNSNRDISARSEGTSCFSHMGEPSEAGVGCLPQLQNTTAELELHEALSPLGDMDWMDTNSSDQYLQDFDSQSRPTLETGVNGFTYDGNVDLEWLSDAALLDSAPAKPSHYAVNTSGGTLFTADPVLSPKPPDLMNIFDLDESDFRVAPESGPDLNWDKLISQASHNL